MVKGRLHTSDFPKIQSVIQSIVGVLVTVVCSGDAEATCNLDHIITLD